jgi:prepilin-type N-terminal cleavage/methylation domain-containing protein
MKKTLFKKTLKSAGFTLVESLVAISILSLSIAGTFTAVQSGIRSSTLAKDQMAAYYLAQEAMEYIKNARDENALHSIYEVTQGRPERSWLYGIASVAGDPCYFGKVCAVDSPAKTVTYCGSASITSNPPNLCSVLKQDPTTKLFGYSLGWTDTVFKREIQFEEISSNLEVRVVITMSWTGNYGNKTFQVAETLFNRQ